MSVNFEMFCVDFAAVLTHFAREEVPLLYFVSFAAFINFLFLFTISFIIVCNS